MRGAVAAGSEVTARAGVETLRAGGNAVDAVVSACFATAAGEPALTSLAGAGVMIYRCGETGEVTVCDFFANAPGLGAEQWEGPLDFFDVELDFGPARQRFHIGAGAAAVPGAIPGLCTAHERWGQLSLSEVVRPAARSLREGEPLARWQAWAVALLEPILFHTEVGRRLFGRDGRPIREGEVFRIAALAQTLEELAERGWREHYRAVLCRQMLEQFGHQAGGRLTPEDLDAFEVRFTAPLAVPYHGGDIYTNPPPAAGGQMIALMLSLLDQPHVRLLQPGSYEHAHALCRAMRVADEARLAAGDDADLVRDTPRWLRRFDGLAGRPLGSVADVPGGPGSTTHVSVIDAQGNAAAVTFSYGEGSGTLIGDCGIMMNNLMGEEDLFPQGFHRWPVGARLATMMSPTIIVQGDGSVSVLGSGGANRIRTALTQVISYLLDHDYDVEHAVRAERLHFEAGVLNAETFEMSDGGASLARLGADKLVCFDHPSLFFGGAHLVRRRADGALEGAGDPRRGGVCLLAS